MMQIRKSCSDVLGGRDSACRRATYTGRVAGTLHRRSRPVVSVSAAEAIRQEHDSR